MAKVSIAEFKNRIAAMDDGRLAGMVETMKMLEDECFAESRPADFEERKALLKAEISSRIEYLTIVEEQS